MKINCNINKINETIEVHPEITIPKHGQRSDGPRPQQLISRKIIKQRHLIKHCGQPEIKRSQRAY